MVHLRNDSTTNGDATPPAETVNTTSAASAASSTAALRRRVQQRHLEVLGTDIDTKVCTYWCNAISEGLKSFDDFERSMIQSNQYEKRVLSLFKAACFDLIGTSGFDSKLFDDFMRVMRNRKTQDPITPDIVDSYIRNTRAFRTKHVPLIKSIATLTTDGELSDADVEAYFTKFKTDRSYDIEAFKADLVGRGAPPVSAPPHVGCSGGGQNGSEAHRHQHQHQHRSSSTSPETGGNRKSSNAEQHGDDDTAIAMMTAPYSSSSSSRNAVQNKHSNSKQHVATSAAAATASPSPLQLQQLQQHPAAGDLVQNVRDVLREFKGVYERPMFVQEYLRFLHDHPLSSRCSGSGNSGNSKDARPSPPSTAEWRSAFEREKPVLCRMMQVIGCAYETYLNAVITEHDIVDKYLPLFEEAARSSDDLFATVKNELVSTPDYEREMSDRISQAYSDAYASDMSRYDVKYVFDKVRGHGLSLTDDRLYDFIRKFKEDMDFIVNNICDTYMAVYDRVPDDKELARHVVDYRARLTNSAYAPKMNKDVECTLVSSLEFQDVMKQKLRQRFMDVHQDSMSPAVLYSALEEALAKLHAAPKHDRALSFVDKIVRECVPSEDKTPAAHQQPTAAATASAAANAAATATATATFAKGERGGGGNYQTRACRDVVSDMEKGKTVDEEEEEDV